MALTRMVDGREVSLSPQEEADQIAEWAANQQAQDVQAAIDIAFNAKKTNDIVVLGTRAEMRAATTAAASIPALRDRVAQLEEIIYTMFKGTID